MLGGLSQKTPNATSGPASEGDTARCTVGHAYPPRRCTGASLGTGYPRHQEARPDSAPARVNRAQPSNAQHAVMPRGFTACRGSASRAVQPAYCCGQAGARPYIRGVRSLRHQHLCMALRQHRLAAERLDSWWPLPRGCRPGHAADISAPGRQETRSAVAPLSMPPSGDSVTAMCTILLRSCASTTSNEEQPKT